jgi:uncharacterized membrane protein YsdA (DUF1294 family)
MERHFMAAVDRRDGAAMRYWRGHLRRFMLLALVGGAPGPRIPYPADGC